MDSSEHAPGDGLLHPIPLVALGVLVLNDHVWKRAFPGVVTGKLSDLAGMAFFPLLLQALWEIARGWAGRPWGPSRRVLLGAMLATGVVFGLAKAWAPANAVVRSAAGVLLQPFRLGWAALHGAPVPPLRPPALAQDPSDLAALPALLLARLAASRRASGRRGAAS